MLLKCFNLAAAQMSQLLNINYHVLQMKLDSVRGLQQCEEYSLFLSSNTEKRYQGCSVWNCFSEDCIKMF